MSKNTRPAPLEDEMGQYLKRTDDLYARALAIGIAAPRKTPVHVQLVNMLYWLAILAVVVWMMSMAIDRDIPVKWTQRDIKNPDHKVDQGKQILVGASRLRTRLCPVVKRQALIDGIGKRHDFEPEPFEAYGPLTGMTPEYDVTGPYVPLDAAPGRGRLITTLAWYCNPLQKALGWPIVYVPAPLEFEITKRAAS